MGIPGLNKEVLDRIIRTLGIQSAVDKLPTELVTTIQPVIIANPKRIIDISHNGATGTTSSILYTTPTSRDFYLTNCNLAVIKDASSTSISTALVVTLASGMEAAILNIPGITLTAQDKGITQNFSTPMKLKKGSTIRLTNTSAVATIRAEGGFQGYMVDIL